MRKIVLYWAIILLGLVGARSANADTFGYYDAGVHFFRHALGASSSDPRGFYDLAAAFYNQQLASVPGVLNASPGTGTLSAAITAAGTGSPEVIWVLPGTYVEPSGVTVPANVWLIGLGGTCQIAGNLTIAPGAKVFGVTCTGVLGGAGARAGYSAAAFGSDAALASASPKTGVAAVNAGDSVQGGISRAIQSAIASARSATTQTYSALDVQLKNNIPEGTVLIFWIGGGTGREVYWFTNGGAFSYLSQPFDVGNTQIDETDSGANGSDPASLVSYCTAGGSADLVDNYLDICRKVGTTDTLTASCVGSYNGAVQSVGVTWYNDTLSPTQLAGLFQVTGHAVQDPIETCENTSGLQPSVTVCPGVYAGDVNVPANVYVNGLPGATILGNITQSAGSGVQGVSVAPGYWVKTPAHTNGNALSSIGLYYSNGCDVSRYIQPTNQLPAVVAAVSKATTLTFFGDSVTAGLGLNSEKQSFVSILSDALGVAATNYGIGGNGLMFDGQTTFDTPSMVGRITATSSADNAIYVALLGYNDAYFGMNAGDYSTDVPFQNDAIMAARWCLHWLAIPSANTVTGASAARTGSWSALTPAANVNAPFASFGYRTTTNGDHAAVIVNGDTVFLGVLKSSGQGGTFTVSEGSNTIGTYSVPSDTIPNHSGVGIASRSTYPYYFKITGLSNAGHNLVITKTAGDELTLLNVTGISSTADKSQWPLVVVGGPLPHSLGPAPGYISAFQSIVREMRADGLNVIYVDVYSPLLNPSTNNMWSNFVTGDYIHPNTAGHAVIAQQILAVLRNQITYPWQTQLSFAGPTGYPWASLGAKSDGTLDVMANAVKVNGMTVPAFTDTSITAGGNMGVAVLSGGTAVVNNTRITANTRILLTIEAPGGTVGSPYVYARSTGTSFTIKSTSDSDTSTVAWLLIEP